MLRMISRKVASIIARYDGVVCWDVLLLSFVMSACTMMHKRQQQIAQGNRSWIAIAHAQSVGVPMRPLRPILLQSGRS